MALGVVVGAALPDGLDGAAVPAVGGRPPCACRCLRGRPLFVMFATAFGASLVGETAAYVVGGMTHLTRLVSAPLSLAQSGVMLAFTYGLVWWVSNQWRLASERSEEALAIQRQILASQRQVLALNERLLATLDPQQVLNLIADSLKAVVPYDNLTIYRVDHDAGVFRPVLARDRFASLILENTFPLEHGITGWVLTHGVAQCVNDAQLDPRMALIPGTPSEDESLIIVPLLIDGDVGGTLNVGRMGGAASHFDSSEFEIAQLLASQASIALQNAEAHHAGLDARRDGCPHRVAEPRSVRGGHRRAARRPERPAAHASDARSRRLQGVQRSAWPPCRRPTARHGRARDERRGPRRRPRVPLRRG